MPVPSVGRISLAMTRSSPRVSMVGMVSMGELQSRLGQKTNSLSNPLISSIKLGRAYLFDNCVNVSIGPAEDRLLITGLHSVCDIFCKRCKTMVGWTYAKAYEASQKYKEGKYIVEKINLHLEESDYYDIAPPAGERSDRFRARSISWGSACSFERHETVYEYGPERQSSVSSAGVGLGSH